MAGEYITGLLESAIAAADRTDPALALSPIQPEASPSRDAGRSAVSPEPAPPFRFHLVSATPMATRDGDAAGIRAPPPLPSSQGEGLLLPEVFVDAPDVEMASNPFSPDSDCQRQQRLSASSTSSGEGVDPLGGFASLSLPGRRGSRFVLQARSQSQSLSNGSGLFLTDICQSLVASRRESIAAATFHNVGVVLPHKLFVTSARHAFDSEEMSAFNITAFLCVAEEVDPPFPPFAKSEQCLHLKLKDIATTQLSEYIPTVMDFVDTQNELGNTVVLYCQAGKSRSVSFAIAFLMRELGLEADAALQELRAGYARAEPNTFFMLQLLNSSIGQEVNPLTSP